MAGAAPGDSQFNSTDESPDVFRHRIGHPVGQETIGRVVVDRLTSDDDRIWVRGIAR